MKCDDKQRSVISEGAEGQSEIDRNKSYSQYDIDFFSSQPTAILISSERGYRRDVEIQF